MSRRSRGKRVRKAEIRRLNDLYDAEPEGSPKRKKIIDRVMSLRHGHPQERRIFPHGTGESVLEEIRQRELRSEMRKKRPSDV